MERNSRLVAAALVLTLTLVLVPNITGKLVAQSSLEMGPPMASPTEVAPAGDSSASLDAVEPEASRRGTVHGGESLHQLMNEPELGPSLPGRRAEPSGIGSMLLRIMAWTLAVLALGAGAMLVLRKYTPLARNLNAGGAVRVLGRTSLSPKHSVFLLRVSNQKILVVGVSGDRMVTLGELSDPTAILGVDREFSSALESFGGQWPEGEKKPLDQEDLYPSRIASHVEPAATRNGDRPTLPYQREVQKIRDLLGSWRSKLHGDGDVEVGDRGKQEDPDVRLTRNDTGDGNR
jgi:flagellar biogenesis protein FliO